MDHSTLLRKLNEHWIWKRKLRVFGHSFRAPTLDRFASLLMYKLGILGHEEATMLRRLVHQGMTVIDVGANQGVYTLLLAHLAGPGSVFAFEPEPTIYRQLVSNVRENGLANVVCSNLAVSSSTGRLILQPGRINLGDNRIVPGASPAPNLAEVKASTLDDLFAGKKVDFLKMDIQGWEAEAFYGARRLLEQNKDIGVMFEYWPYGLVRSGSVPKKLLAFFYDLGFRLWQLRKGRLTDLNEKNLPNSAIELSYCNLVGTRNLSFVKDLLT